MMQQLITFILLLGFAQLSFAQVLLRGPYLQQPTSESIMVCWRTDSLTRGVVKYGPSPSNLLWTSTETQASTDHRVLLSNLDPDTKYFYSIGDSLYTLSGPASDHHFTTHPLPGTITPVRLWAIGDFGRANQRQLDVANAFLQFNNNEAADAWLWLGDNVYYDGLDEEYQQKVFDTAVAYGQILRFMPFYPVPGNHDYDGINRFDPPTQHTGPYYDIIETPLNAEAGGLTSGTELYYSFDIGNVHCVAINSELQEYTGAIPFTNFNGSPMSDWLEDDLAANTLPWTVVYFHQPPYSRGSHNSDDIWELYMGAMRENFTPIFDEYGVDLVLCGHSHVYERSYPIVGLTDYSNSYNPAVHQVDAGSGNYNAGEPYIKTLSGPKQNTGTIYVVVGNSGNSEDQATLDHPVMYFGDAGADICGSVVIDVNGNRMDTKYLRYDGQILDDFTIIKSDTLTSVTEELLFDDLQLYPNPFNSILTAEFTLQKETTLTIDILDLNGRVLNVFEEARSFNEGKHKSILDFSQLQLDDGLYYIRLFDEAGTEIRRVMKLQ